MRILVVGAGASVAEGLALGLSIDQCPPLISNFARKLWSEYNPHPILDRYLESNGYDVEDRDGRSLFYELEESPATRGKINIERFFEFAWRHRNKDWSTDLDAAGNLPKDYISGFNIASGSNSGPQPRPSGWQDLLLHGLGGPLQFNIISHFHENGVGWRQLLLGQSVARLLNPGDAVLNLNYDTLFELALKQSKTQFAYSPNQIRPSEITICKPHGSLSLAVYEHPARFAFSEPDWLGVPAPPGCISFSGLLPPRFNKSYAHLPIAKTILAPLTGAQPDILSFWGVGFTSSDVSLLEAYRNWARTCEAIEIINPDANVAKTAEDLLYSSTTHYPDVQSWLRSTE